MLKGKCLTILKGKCDDINYLISTDSSSLLNGNISIDIAILDIKISPKGELSLADLLRRKNTNTNIKIIFVTPFYQYSLKGYHVHAHRYLLRPLNFIEFKEAILSAIDEIICLKYIHLKLDHTRIRILIEDILYIESVGSNSIAYTEFSHYYNYSSSKKLMEQLSLTNTFIRIHKSYIANLQHTKEFAGNHITLINGIELPVSVRNSKVVKQAFLKQG
jgi:DNA-binding LytR/AlgR family response regulator